MSTPILTLISRYRHFAFLILSVFGFLSFGLYHISSFITADEHYWVEERVPQYWSAWNDWKLKKTYINDKPGVSLALISGIALPFLDQTTVTCQYDEGRFRNCEPNKTATLYLAFRLPILIVNAILLIALFFSVRAFSTSFVASATVFFTALSPHLVGISQIINPDALLWSSGSVALFSFLALLKTGKWRFFFLATLTLALALLSKYTALIILFFLPILVLILYLADKDFSALTLKYQTLALLGISLGAIALFLLCIPGIILSNDAKVRFITYFTAGTLSTLPWVGYVTLILSLIIMAFFRIPRKSKDFLTSITINTLRVIGLVFLFSSIIAVAVRLVFPEWAPFTVPNDIKDLTNARYYLGRFLTPIEIGTIELSALLYSIPIIPWLLTLFATGTAVFATTQQSRLFRLCIVFFLVLNLAALGFSNVFAVSRYVILLFPMIAYLAAAGLAEILSHIQRRHLPRTKTILLIFIGIIAITSLFSTTPYYANYSNILLPPRALQDHGWGYGGYEAAKYLNNLPDAKNITIWSDYYGTCEFFIGRCLTAYTLKEDERGPSYYVLTKRGKTRYMSRFPRWEAKSGLIAHKYYDHPHPDFAIEINGKSENFVRVYKVEYPN